jgi:hypothetical protein
VAVLVLAGRRRGQLRDLLCEGCRIDGVYHGDGVLVE